MLDSGAEVWLVRLPLSTTVHHKSNAMIQGYQVLALKWRPKNFADMVGQQHVVQTLTNALIQQRLHHAYLFTGTRGVGKTTVARIIAKCLNCEIGLTDKPCEQCSACVEINSGRFIDLIEVDAASRTKVEDTREMLDNVQYAPSIGRYKVYLIDEVHMLSGHSFNALLKTLEEPPPHVKFLLATTDPQKLPATVLSRCLQFHLKNLTIEQISQHLTYVLQQENIPAEETALLQLGRAADGSMRDALSLLDQAIAFGNGAVSLTTVRSMLGSLCPSHLYSLIEALIQNNAQALFNGIQALAEQGADFAQALEDLLDLFHQMALLQAIPTLNASLFADNETPRALAQQLTAEQLQLYYQIAVLGRRDLPFAPTPRSGFEMTLLRMLSFYPETATGGGTSTSTNTPAKTTAGIATSASTNSGARTAAGTLISTSANTGARPAAGNATSTPANAGAKPASGTATSASANTGARAATGNAASALANADARSASATASLVAGSQDIPSPNNPASRPTDISNWESILPYLRLSGAAVAVAQHCLLLDISQDRVLLQVAPGQAPMINANLKARFQAALSDHFGKPMTVEFELVKPTQVSPATPAAKQVAMQQARQEQAETAIATDDNVQAILDTFNATLVPDSVEPTD